MSNASGKPGPHVSRRSLLQGGLAVGTLVLGQSVVRGQSGGAHDHHMPEIGVANVPIASAIGTSAARASTCAVTKAGSRRRCA